MKKILAALLILALVAPAMANVAITSSFDNGTKNLTISFAPTLSAEVRGIAVSVTVTGATVDSYVAGSSSFNTFVDQAFTTGAGYAIGDGHPIALEAVAGVATPPIASGTPFALSVGYLKNTAPFDQSGLITAGTVAVLHLTSIAPAGGTVAVVANAARGGAVVGDDIGTVTVTGTTIPAQGFNLNTSSTTGGDVTTPAVEGDHAGQSGSVAIVATPDAGYQFVNWTGTGAAAGKITNVNAASTQILMDADYTAIANFALAHTVGTPGVPTVLGTRFFGGTVPAVQALPVTGSVAGGLCSHGHALQYRFNWGDGTPISTWGLAKQNKGYGTPAYVWTITAQARCATTTTIESAWSAPATGTVANECQKFNLTRRINAATDNALTASDLNVLIGFVNLPGNRTNPAAFAMGSTHPNYDARYNFDGTASITAGDLNVIIGYVNAARTNSAAFARSCVAIPAGQ